MFLNVRIRIIQFWVDAFWWGIQRWLPVFLIWSYVELFSGCLMVGSLNDFKDMTIEETLNFKDGSIVFWIMSKFITKNRDFEGSFNPIISASKGWIGFLTIFVKEFCFSWSSEANEVKSGARITSCTNSSRSLIVFDVALLWNHFMRRKINIFAKAFWLGVSFGPIREKLGELSVWSKWKNLSGVYEGGPPW